jgi:NAD(P)-dependent dehydrogenase (short-subunit alcohol dehydrogenase family)
MRPFLYTLLFHSNNYSSSMANHKYALVTGGNRGIGFEVCKQLVDWKKPVILTCRNVEAGEMCGTCHVCGIKCIRGTNEPVLCKRKSRLRHCYGSTRFAGKAVAAELSSGGTDVRVLSLDTGNAASIQDLAQHIKTEYDQQIDLLVSEL